MDSFLGGTAGPASSSFYEYEYAKADLSSSRLSIGRGVASSPPAPSKMIPTKPAVLPSIFDQIAEWFTGIVGRRKIIAAAVSSGTTVALFFLLTAVLQATPWAPFASVYGAVSLLFSPSAWTAAIVVWIASFLALALVTFTFATPEVTRRVCLLRKDAWAAAATFWMSQMVLVAAALAMSETTMESSRWLFTLIAVAAVSAHVIFRLDYRLVFGSFGSKLSLAIWECVSLEGESPLLISIKEAALIYRAVMAASLVIGSLVLGIYSTLLALLSPTLHISLFLSTAAVVFVGRANIRLTREIVMKPIHFPLPPPHAIRCPTPVQTRTMLNVLEANDATLKVFALTDLSRLSRVVGDRRLEIFSLSQPGGHPRNWTSIKNACVRIIDDAREKMEAATRSVVGRSGAFIDSDDEEDSANVDRQMLLMPERIRQQVYSSAVRSRHQRTLRATATLQPRAPPRPTMLERARRLLEVPSGVLTRHDATLVQLAAESLHLLIVASFDEDRYGVVQRDLAEVLRAIVRTANAIREHFRARNARATDSEEDAPMCAVDDALHTAVYQIKNQFGDCLRSLALSKEEFAAIDMMC
ncbi:hypothetical protein PFISCL1PPCAC_912 [Pristionchus fissidentatus]|uniref:Uncharacterized protein n=1 Tax=Pristionchus fissidentatus TaxID=1538716 RepID=A0AAV5UVP6_9BILA|nr:hypothetical protein PFISCL1PPCAC_912 [Pristionchus fissidentatus]